MAPSLPTGELTPEEELEKIQAEQAKQQGQLTLMQKINNVMLIILVIAFITILFTVYGIIQDYLANKQATYQNLVNQVTEQNVKIDVMMDEIRQFRQIQLQAPIPQQPQQPQ